jgi:hypothetical protein
MSIKIGPGVKYLHFFSEEARLQPIKVLLRLCRAPSFTNVHATELLPRHTSRVVVPLAILLRMGWSTLELVVPFVVTFLIHIN